MNSSLECAVTSSKRIVLLLAVAPNTQATTNATEAATNQRKNRYMAFDVMLAPFGGTCFRSACFSLPRDTMWCAPHDSPRPACFGYRRSADRLGTARRHGVQGGAPAASRKTFGTPIPRALHGCRQPGRIARNRGLRPAGPDGLHPGIDGMRNRILRLRQRWLAGHPGSFGHAARRSRA